MAQNLEFNPVARDYIIVNGSPIGSDNINEASYYAIMIPQNKWLYGQPGQGSLIYTLNNIKRSSSVEQQFANYANDAIKRQVINSRQALGVNTKNITTTRTGTLNQINVVPSLIQLSNQLNFSQV